MPIYKNGNAKECSNYQTIAFVSQASKILLKILQKRREPYMERETLKEQEGFRKGRGTHDK